MASIVKRAGRRLPNFVFWREPGSKKLRSKAFARKKEAEDYRDTLSTDLRRRTYTDPRPIAFEVFAEDRLIRTKPAVSANTGGLYEWAVNKYLIRPSGLPRFRTSRRKSSSAGRRNSSRRASPARGALRSAGWRWARC